MLNVDGTREVTRIYPAPAQNKTSSRKWYIEFIAPGESSTANLFGVAGNVEALGATGRLWMVPDDCPDGSAECGKVIHPHYCPDDPGRDNANCTYRPQYLRGGAYEQTFIIYNDFMGVRIEADQTTVAEGTAVTYTLHRHGGEAEQPGQDP